MALFLRILIYGGIPVIIALAIYGYISSLPAKPVETSSPTISAEVITSDTSPSSEGGAGTETTTANTLTPTLSKSETQQTTTSTSPKPTPTSPKNTETDQMTKELDALIDDIVGN